jgi:hypothetical protein
VLYGEFEIYEIFAMEEFRIEFEGKTDGGWYGLKSWMME